jgi:hypothetical protein
MPNLAQLTNNNRKFYGQSEQVSFQILNFTD